MRIVTWNINGIRTLPQYHPWNNLKTFDDILNHIQADILCFQEVKSSRQALPKQFALPPSYDAFFSFPVKKSGYSGVATYTRTSVVMPIKAEEGLSGLIQPRPPLSDEERISHPNIYPPDLADPTSEEVDYKELDSEGRAVVVDLGLFVLVNVYCPNNGSDEREQFKMDYHRLLETRVRGLIQEGRQVMVVGDLNACASVEDHCEGRLMVARGLAEGLQGEEGFWGKGYRRWIRNWLLKDDGTGGCMVDIVRKFWPERKGMYTCWNTKISARETNYGTRIDFILVTPGLIPWIKAADIQPHVKGSDHCPVFVDLRDEITNVDASVTKLEDVLGVSRNNPVGPARLAAQHWEEHKQKLLSTFFGKKSDPVCTPSETPTSGSLSQQSSNDMDLPDSHPAVQQETGSQTSITSEPPPATAKRKLPTNNPQTSSKKTKTSSTQMPTKGLSKTKAKGEANASQTTIASFFSQPRPPQSFKSASPTSTSTQSKPHGKRKADDTFTEEVEPHLVQSSPYIPNIDEDADYQLALQLSQSDSILRSPSRTRAIQEKGPPDTENYGKKSKQAWSSLLAPTQIPRCVVHDEPAKEFTVNKPGPNKGKRFFICSRPVGPGYDRGYADRPREQVDPQYRCNFFKWSSDVRKEMTKSEQL